MVAGPRPDAVPDTPGVTLEPPRRNELLAGASALLYPINYPETFGLVLVEAMASGVPAVVNRAVGAAGDLAVHGENCLVVDGEDAELWASAIELLAGDGELRRRLGEEARRTVEARWTLEHSADAWIAGMRLGLELSGSGTT